jgi:hypothetical protein
VADMFNTTFAELQVLNPSLDEECSNLDYGYA